MRLIDFVKNLHDFDDEAIIFQENRSDVNSDIFISYAEEGDEGVKEELGRKYSYLLEVFLAKEFIEDWVASLRRKPTVEQITKRLHEYAINDA